MSKITLNNVGSLIDATTAAATINANSAAISTAIEKTLSRDGTAPNTMQASLDMNSNQIFNLPAPATANSPLRLQDLTDFNNGGTVTNIPAGGTTNQVLAKTSNVNYQIGWANSVTSVGLSLPSDLTVTNSPVTTTGTLTGAWAVAPTGSGSMVRATSPTLVTPNLGTPNSGVATNLTGTAAGLTAGNVTTNANLTGDVTSVGNATTLTNAPVIAKVLTGYTSGAGTVTASDSILSAIQKLNGNNATNANLTGPITSVGNATSIASQTGTGSKFVVDTSPTLVTPAIGAATGVSLALSGGLTFSTSGQGVVGTTTNNNANTGIVGEYVSSTVAVGSAVALTANIPINITTISLTAGDWDVDFEAIFTGSGSTLVNNLMASVSTTSGTLNTTPGNILVQSQPGNAAFSQTGAGISGNVGPARLSLASTTTVYAVAQGGFTASTAGCYGILRARRMR